MIPPLQLGTPSRRTPPATALVPAPSLPPSTAPAGPSKQVRPRRAQDGFERSTEPLDPYALSKPDELMVAHWNAEKLMEPGADRSELLLPAAYGVDNLRRHAENLGAQIRRLNGGAGPDVLALTEVGSPKALDTLADSPALRDLGYQTRVVLKTSDEYGMHPALLSRFPLVERPRLHDLTLPGANERARELLEATVDTGASGSPEPLTVFVNHWTWRGGGQGHEEKRIHAGARQRELVQQTLARDPKRAVVIVGDFNDDMEDASIASPDGLHAAAKPEQLDGNRVYNTTECLKEMKARSGDDAPNSGIQVASCFWDHGNAWNSFDQLLVSSPMMDGRSGLSWIPGSTVVVADRALRKDDPVKDAKPFFVPRDGEGLTVNDEGISDHFPIVARLRRAPAAAEQSA